VAKAQLFLRASRPPLADRRRLVPWVPSQDVPRLSWRAAGQEDRARPGL